MVDKYSNRENVGITKQVLKPIDDTIESLIQKNSYNLTNLAKIYFDFFEGLKEKAGTSAGFTGLSEYIILKTLLRYLEENLRTEFNDAKELTRDVYFFVSKDRKILVTHSITIDETKKKEFKSKLGKEVIWGLKKQPDIVVFKLKRGYYKPIVIIQIKIYAVNQEVIRNTIESFKNMVKNTGYENFEIPLMVLISFHEFGKRKKEIIDIIHEEFLNKYPGKAFVLMFSKETQSEKSYPKNFSFKKLLDEIRQALIS